MKHKWNKTQIKALKSSILHWERMRDNKRRKMGTSITSPLEAPGSDCCACCKLYNNKGSAGIKCNHCPIYLHTGRVYCQATPFDEASAVFDEEWRSPVFRAKAQKMIKFMENVLKSGIPKEIKK